jgi:photosystem II stability/assembly factor-like uncharacterized protein
MRLSSRPAFFVLALLLLAFSACDPLRPAQPNIPNGGRAVAVAVDPGDADRIVVASETGGLFRSTNRGVDWTQVSRGATFGFADVVHIPSNPTIVVAAARQDMRVTSGGGLWRSTDAGATWSRVAVTAPTADCTTNLAAYSVTIEPSSQRLWAGTQCGVAFSTDSGVTWQYLPIAPGYNNDTTFAVIPATNTHLKILTYAGVKVTTDGGGSWSVSTSGLPSNIGIGVHNQIAMSPLDEQHLYWAFNYWVWNADAGKWDGHIALFRSLDNGSTWSSVIDNGGINRPPFVKATRPSDGSHYTLYFANGACSLQRATVTHGATPTISAFAALTMDHCDPADLGFDTDGRTPLLLASDGGLHKTTDGGAHWTFAGAAGHGYAALQMTETTGQMGGSTADTDLYFGTQDNDVWSSGDNGATWTGRRCCEGFFLNVWRDPLPPADTKVSGVTCAGCGNFISGPVLSAQGGFPNPPNDAGNPRLLSPGSYIHNTRVSGLSANIFDLTTDNGTSWTPRYGFTEDVRALSSVAQPGSNAIVFTAVRESGSTPGGQEIVGIKRITDVLGSGTPVVSDITSFGSLGIFPTMFAWYKPYGVDPANPDFFIVPDIVDDVVKVSRDGGGTWTPDTALTTLVTESGSLRFRKGAFTQISSFGYDPVCRGHILVGTVQAGMFQTFDFAATWSKVKHSERIPNISGFFFAQKGEVVLSSYGRGLWRYSYSCPSRVRVPPIVRLGEPTIYWKGGRIPISQIHNPDACPVCIWALVQGGEVIDYSVNAQTGRIEEVQISGGQVRGFTWDRAGVELPFRTSIARGRAVFSEDRSLAAQLRDGKLHAKGLLVENGLPKGIVLASNDMTPEQIPARKVEAPRIQVDIPSHGGVGVPIGSVSAITIRGHRFDRSAPIEVLVDDQPLKIDRTPEIDDRGEFTMTATPPPLNVGEHTIAVRQRTSRGILQDVFTFNVTVRDEPGKDVR